MNGCMFGRIDGELLRSCSKAFCCTQSKIGQEEITFRGMISCHAMLHLGGFFWHSVVYYFSGARHTSLIMFLTYCAFASRLWLLHENHLHLVRSLDVSLLAF